MMAEEMEAMKMRPTPQADDADNVNPSEKRRTTLVKKVNQMLPTPHAASRENVTLGGHCGLAGGRHDRAKLKEIMGEQEGRLMACGQLNPDWVEWLMGFPVGHTSLTSQESQQE